MDYIFPDFRLSVTYSLHRAVILSTHVKKKKSRNREQ